MTDALPRSPFGGLLGLRVKHWSPNLAEVELPITPDIRNVAGALAGGVIATLVDFAGSMAGSYSDNEAEKHAVLSVSLFVNYISMAREGTVTARGERRGGGRNLFMSSVEIVDEGGRLIATGEGSFKLLRKRP